MAQHSIIALIIGLTLIAVLSLSGTGGVCLSVCMWRTEGRVRYDSACVKETMCNRVMTHVFVHCCDHRLHVLFCKKRECCNNCWLS